MKVSSRPLIIISGPTATGKTKTSIDLSLAIEQNFSRRVAVVNFDSLLFYKEISIGTAKPTLKEQAGIEHFLIGIESIANALNAAQFIKMAEELITTLFEQNKIVILVGGSAFYLRALLKGMYDSPTPTPELKNKLDLWYRDQGIAPFIEYLRLRDPESLLTLHSNDHYRLIRAVEHFEMTQTKMSLKKAMADDLNPYDFSQIIHPWEVLHLHLDVPKSEHYQIILSRTRQMFASGLMEEIEGLRQQGFSLSEKPLASIGYKEAIQFKNGLFTDEEQCIERIAISTRQLAKSQRTFFNKITPKESFNPLVDQVKIMKRVETFIKATL